MSTAAASSFWIMPDSPQPQTIARTFFLKLLCCLGPGWEQEALPFYAAFMEAYRIKRIDNEFQANRKIVGLGIASLPSGSDTRVGTPISRRLRESNRDAAHPLAYREPLVRHEPGRAR
ncbi:hypothetical protein OAR36_04340 [Pseudomonadales bacterium]|nr:hypothetical protein [Pseudomonadales bacterium]